MSKDPDRPVTLADLYEFLPRVIHYVLTMEQVNRVREDAGLDPLPILAYRENWQDDTADSDPGPNEVR